MQQSRWVSLLKVAAFVAVAAVLPSVVRAQTGKIAGVVTDAQSGQPIEGVQINLQGTGIGALTSANGRFFIISVPPGTYTVIARRIGYQQVEQSGVAVRIDATREVNFSLSSAAGVLAVTRITAPPVPLVEQGITGSSAAITTETIDAMPVTSISGVLALQQGFFEVPQNTDITSFSDTRRNVLSPIRIRGGRQGETLTLIDGIPINNIVFGDRAFDITNAAVQQIDYQKGGMEPQYGNALSGIINLATKEGGARMAGNVEYQTTGLGGSLGSDADEVRGYDMVRGYLSGPVPGTNSKLRFMFAGQTQNGADRVLEFDQDINVRGRTSTRTIQTLDLYPGFRAFGFDSQRDVFGKLTFNITPSSKLNLSVIDYERQRLPFDFDYAFSGFDPLRAPVIRTLEDTLRVLGSSANRDVAQGSIRAARQLFSGSLEQRFGRSNLRVRVAQFNQQRQTCNFFQGICLGNNFQDNNFTESFVSPNTTPVVPGNTPTGSDIFYGGEKVRTSIMRGDFETQATDHHNLQAGVFYQRHDIAFAEARNLGTNNVYVVPLAYNTKPWDAASYVQDRIEYDFLTVKLGFRYDYGKATGSFFKNPLDPTNGTTAREVCQGRASTLGATTPFTGIDTVTGQTLTGLAACTNQNQAKNGSRTALLDSATRLAQQDDFAEAPARRAFSPRIGVSFPLAERTALFFNAGRYSQNPLYNNLYQNTNVGLKVGSGCSSEDLGMEQPGGTKCSPTIYSDAYTTAFLGNTNLALEQTTSYEVGYASEVGRNYAVRVTLFSKDQTGLSGIRQSDRTINDIGSTYGTASPRYNVIINQDYGTSRGIEVQLNRRLSNYWGYDINYSFSKATTNSAPPEAAQQRNSQGDPTSRREITSEIDIPHSFNAALQFRVGAQAPNIRFGNYLRHSYLTVTTRASSGVPYTPITDFSGTSDRAQLDVNSARSPMTMQTDALLGKDLQFSNVRYGVFLRMVNLLDRKNCLQVFVSTGRCDAGAPDQDRANQGNPVGGDASTSFFDRAGYYGERRSIYAGVRLDF